MATERDAVAVGDTADSFGLAVAAADMAVGLDIARSFDFDCYCCLS